MNQKNLTGLNPCFLNLDNPFDLFKKWLSEAEKSEKNDPNALSLATSSSNGLPNVRIVLLKGLTEKGFVFYTNLESVKSIEIKENPNGAMCFYWKSLSRQVRILGIISKVSDEEADKYYNTRSYGSRIAAWASKQSSVLKDKSELIKKIGEIKKKYKDKNNVPRPPFWSGWILNPNSIEFWLSGEDRVHERLKYDKEAQGWKKTILYP